ncbi:DNL zinc finger-domain-containing protein [Lipomyces kononenkoae]|uniref:DNL zinc finger-domain-containing protein n=1 Tax=Lipomyces kononenkoae TaxID=34357 RepID=A0ACC3SZC3_LIPKO
MWKLSASAITGRGLGLLQPGIVAPQIRAVVRISARYQQRRRPLSVTAISRSGSQQNRTIATPETHTHTHADGDSQSISQTSHSPSHESSFREVARTKIPVDKPTYNITLTCKVCKNRSSHFMSHQAYHHGTVLVKCPGCNNRHLIADHLKIFSDSRITVEDIIAKEGGVVRKGTLAEYRGDITEFTEPPVPPDDTEERIG